MIESKLVKALGLEYNPVSLLWTDEKPEKAISFGVNKFGCVMFHLVAAAKGRTAVIGRDTYGCPGGGVGMGFGNRYDDFPGGCASFYGFLSNGCGDTEIGKKIAAGIAASGNRDMADEMLHGERYVKDPEATKCFVDALPLQDIPAKYVVLRPMQDGDLENSEVQNITLFVTPEQLSALVVMANYEHPERENVGIPYAAGCQVIGILMYREQKQAHPRALVGLTDLSARKNVQRTMGKDKMTFTMTPAMFKSMEANVDTSFFHRHTWEALQSTAP